MLLTGSLTGRGMGEGGECQQRTTCGGPARQGQGAQSSGIARQDIPKPSSGGMGAGAAELPALTSGISNDTAGALEQHRAAAALGRCRAGLQGGLPREIREDPLELTAMGGEPGGAATAQ